MAASDDRAARSHLAARQALYEQYGSAQVALSTDGRTVHLWAPVEAGLRIGGFAIVEGVTVQGADDVNASGVVVQTRSVELVERPGPELHVVDMLGDVRLGAQSTTATSAVVRPMLRGVSGTAAVLGTITNGGFAPAAQVSPFAECLVRPATAEDTRVIVEGLCADRPVFPIGVLRDAPDIRASLVSTGFARHTFMCGQSGSGKTYTTGAIFERLLGWTTLPVVIFDLNSDHVHVGTLADPDDADLGSQAGRLAEAAREVRVVRARGVEGDILLCADFSDLGLDWQALLLRLHPIADADEFEALRRLTSSMPTPYSVDDVVTAAESEGVDPVTRRIATRIRNLGIAEWDVWRRPGETSIAAGGLRDERCVVVDLGSLSRPDERSAVALAVLGARWRARHDRRPVLLAIDEAHNLLPAVTDDPLLQATADLGVLIAGEGRKFGLHLFVATQRPAKVHPNVVSQCDNVILMRMNGMSDVDDLSTLFSHVPEAMLRAAVSFGLGQALLAGPISPVPVIAQIGRRFTPEGGGDVPTTWAMPQR